jgi:hypothetical protein
MRKVNNVNYEVDFPQYQNQSRIIHVQHIKPWRGLPNNENEEIPSPGSYKEKITKKEKRMDQIQNRPITRAYAKLLKQLDQSKQDIKPIACLYDEANDTIIEYLRQDQLQPEGITVADDSS